ncbi:MAG: hypothetical protein QM754_06845 [Tepidisphaeraceae bacterium]
MDVRFPQMSPEGMRVEAGDASDIVPRMGKKPRASKSEKFIATEPAPAAPRPGRPSALLDTRVVYCGDNLEQLANLPDACVDLIYIDPPFDSNRNYEVFWGETKEKRASKTAMPARKPTSTTCGPAASNSPASSKRLGDGKA